jgi:hypothetical protein
MSGDQPEIADLPVSQVLRDRRQAYLALAPLDQQPPPCAVTVRQAFLSITDRALGVPGPFLLTPAIVILT